MRYLRKLQETEKMDLGKLAWMILNKSLFIVAPIRNIKFELNSDFVFSSCAPNIVHKHTHKFFKITCSDCGDLKTDIFGFL